MKTTPKSFTNFWKLGVHILVCVCPIFVQNNYVTLRKSVWVCDKSFFSISSSSTLGLWFSCCTWFPQLHFESPVICGSGFMFHCCQRSPHAHWVLRVLQLDKNNVTYQDVPPWTKLDLVFPWQSRTNQPSPRCRVWCLQPPTALSIPAFVVETLIITWYSLLIYSWLVITSPLS